MTSLDFQQLVEHIRKSLTCSYAGLSQVEVQQLHQRLDSDAYKAAKAVEEFFEAKRLEC